MSKYELTDESDFEDVIGVLFSNWKTLRLSFEHRMGGNYKIMQMKIKDLIQNIHEALKQIECFDDIWLDNVSPFIDDVMDIGFNVEVDTLDNEELSRDICSFYISWNKTPHEREKVLAELEESPIKIPIQMIPIEKICEVLMIDVLLSDVSDEDSETDY